MLCHAGCPRCARAAAGGGAAENGGETRVVVLELYLRRSSMATKPTKRGKVKASGKSRAKGLPPRKAADVKGGSLNTYYTKVSGEKQGQFKGG
jgi:hypothetical protein